jgi:beta-N-acetylhexosaminidase
LSPKMNLNLSLREKVGQLFMVGFPGLNPGEEFSRFIGKNNIGFVILFSRNIQSVSQVVDLTNEIHALAPVSPFIYTDQEGGTVVQFREMAATVVSPMGLAASGNPENSRIAGRIIGKELNACGIDGILAPVLDVNIEEKNPIIGIRSFSDDPETVIRFARAFLKGLHENGMAGCGKHYPGHGATAQDSHLEIPRVEMTELIFLQYCFKPFSVLASCGIDSLMTAHVKFPGISDEPATFSPYLINHLLRKIAGYQGVVMSDCMEMQAVKNHYSPSEIIEKAVGSGIDLLTVSHHLDFQEDLFNRLLFQVKKGVIPEKRIDESLTRVLNLKKKFKHLEPRKYLDFRTSGPLVRSHRHLEQRIADESITVLRNQRHVIPLGRKQKILILEWLKVKATQALSEAEDMSMLGRIARDYFEHVEVQILKLDGSLPGNIQSFMEPFDVVLAGLYSRNPEMESIQSRGLNRLLKMRDDIIAVLLGNPYDIRNFPQIQTCLLTYGFRDVQVQALFKVLRGEINGSGKLPVQISGLYTRGYELS